MSVPRMTARIDKPASPRTPEPADEYPARAAEGKEGRKDGAGATEHLHVVYLSGGIDMDRTNAHVIRALDRHGLRHAAVIAHLGLGDTSDARKHAVLEQLRGLFRKGLVGPDTRIIVQLHGDDDPDGFTLSANGVIDKLPWEELRATLRHPTENDSWHGDVLLGCCEAGKLDKSLPTDEGNYVLLSGKKTLASGALRDQLTSLFDFVASHVRKKHRMPSSEKIWQFLTQISGENIRRVDANGITRTKAGEVHVRKPRPGETGKRALSAAHARQPSQLLISKLAHGSAASVAKVLREHGTKAVSDALLNEVSPLGWLALSERDTEEKVALLFAIDQTDIAFGESTLLHLACLRDHEALLRALLKQGVDVDRRDDKQQTALHVAAARGGLKLAELLLDYGARVGATDADGKTPLYYAERGGHIELAALLRKQQAAQLSKDRGSDRKSDQ